MKSRVVFSRHSDEWETPQDLFDQLNAEFYFDMDCAATAKNTKCDRWLGPGGMYEDALDAPWGKRNWLNPPYSQVRQFVYEAVARSADGSLVVMLLPSRTDTRWFHEFIWDRECHRPRRNVEVRFLKGRLKFSRAMAGAPFPSLIAVLR